MEEKLLVLSDLFAQGEGVPDNVTISQTGLYAPSMGEPREISESDFDKMIENFNANVLKTKISVYYSHWDMRRTAAGEVTSIFKTKNEANLKAMLNASITWTPMGKKGILEREYKYISAEIYFNFRRPINKDGQFQEYGPVLTGIALTNEPAIYDIPPIVYSGNKKFLAQFQKPVSNKNTSVNKGVSKMDIQELLKRMNVTSAEDALKHFTSVKSELDELKNDKAKEKFSEQMATRDKTIESLKKELDDIKEEHFSKEKKSYLDELFESKKITKERYNSVMDYNEEKFSMFKEVMSESGTKTVLPEPKGSFAQKGTNEEVGPGDFKKFAEKATLESLKEEAE